MQKSSTLVGVGLIALIGLIALPPLLSDVAARVSAAPAPFAPADLTIGRSHALFQAFQLYAVDNDETLPPMTSAATFDTALAPYVKDPATFTSPDSGQPFLPNAALNGFTLAVLKSPYTTPIFQDTPSGQPATVTFLDGHVERGGVETGDPVLISIGRARLLALGVTQYTQDNDSVLPPMQTSAAFQTAIFPYVRSLAEFTDNLTGGPFVPNAALSGLPAGRVPASEITIPLVASAQAAADGFKTVAYLDGHATHGNIVQPPMTDIRNIRTLLLASIQYAQDNDEHLPPLQSEAAFESSLQLYLTFPFLLSAPVTFADPETGQPYLLNANLSGVSLASLADPTTAWVLEDSTPNPDGSLNIGYADGHVGTMYHGVPYTVAVSADNLTHLVWAKADGSAAFTTISPTGVAGATTFSPAAFGSKLAGAGVTADGSLRLLFNLGKGAETIQAVSPAGDLTALSGDGPYDGWTPGPIGVTPAGQTILLWGRYDGKYVQRVLSPDGQPFSTFFFTPPAGWAATGAASAPDGTARVLITQAGSAIIVQTRLTGGIITARVYRDAGFAALGLSVSPDDLQRLLWAAPDGRAELWTLSASGVPLRTVALPAAPGWTPLGVSVGPDGVARVLSRNAAGVARVQFVSSAGVTLGTVNYAPPQ